MDKFPCSCCGACCRNIKKAVIHYKASFPDYEFPFEWDSSGKCSQLEENKCKVYENRPLICNVDRFIEAHNLDKEIFYAINIQACNTLMDEQNIDEQYRIKI